MQEAVQLHFIWCLYGEENVCNNTYC